MSLEYNPTAPELLNRALQQAIWLSQHKKHLYCFVVWESNSEEGYEAFEVDDYAEGLSRARAFIRQLPESVGQYVLGYDGYLRLDGRRQDAIFLEAGESGNPQAQLFAQPYAPKTLLRRVVTVGELIYLEPVKTHMWSFEPSKNPQVWASQSFS